MEENEILIRCPQIDDEILHVMALLKSHNQRLCVLDEKKQMIFISPSEVFYVESLEDKTFLYVEKMVYQISLTLAELTSKYEEVGFCRIGKSVTVNMHQIEKLRVVQGGRIEITLKNKEKLIVSRHYASLFKQQLGI